MEDKRGATPAKTGNVKASSAFCLVLASNCVNKPTVKFPENGGGGAELINIFGFSGRGQ